MLDARERASEQLGAGGEARVGDSGQTEWPDAAAAATAPYPHFVCGGSVSEKLQKLAAAMPSAVSVR